VGGTDSGGTGNPPFNKSLLKKLKKETSKKFLGYFLKGN